MADVTPRWSYTNLCAASGLTMVVSSAQAAIPAQWAIDPLPSKPWRSASGYNALPGFNSALPFDGTDGKRICYLPSPNQSTPTTFAAAVSTAMNNAGYHPKALSSWSAEWRGDKSTISAANRVSAAADMSGLGSRDMSQGTGAQQPLLVANALSTGRHAWYFDGTNQSLVCAANLSALAGASGIVLIKVEFCLDSDAVAGAMLVWAASGADVVDLSWQGTTVFQARATDATSTKVASKTATNGVGVIGVALLRFDLSNLSAGAFNSASASLQNTAMTAAIKASVLGTPLHIGSDGTHHFKGYIFGVQVYNAGTAAHDRLAMTSKQRYAGLIDGAGAPVWGDVWSCTYSLTTKQFTISHTSGAGTITIPAAAQPAWLGAEDWGELAWKDIGITTDRTAVTTAVADTVSYHSRECWQIDLGVNSAITVAAVLGHTPLATGGAITFYGNVDTKSTVWGAPTFTQVLSGDDRIRVAFVASQSLRYLRITVDDIQNTLAYSQIGVAWAGTYFQPGRSISVGYKEVTDDTSVIRMSDYGAIRRNKKVQMKLWAIQFPRLRQSDKVVFDTLFAAAGLGGHLLLSLDPQNNPTTTTRYGVIEKAMEAGHSVGDGTPPERWTMVTNFRESVG